MIDCILLHGCLRSTRLRHAALKEAFTRLRVDYGSTISRQPQVSSSRPADEITMDHGGSLKSSGKSTEGGVEGNNGANHELAGTRTGQFPRPVGSVDWKDALTNKLKEMRQVSR